MDLWNNSLGRKYGKKAKNKEKLFKLLLQALKDGELIINIDDPRKYQGATTIKDKTAGLVIVLEESKSGENIIFYDIEQKNTMSRNEFVALIKEGHYPSYEIRNIEGNEVPASKKDGLKFNNLG